MIKILKYLAAFTTVATITTGVFFYFSFTNIHFVIRNESNIPITVRITLHSNAKNKNYTYPLLGNEAVPAGGSVESFYTIDKDSDGTQCVDVEFRDKEDRAIHKFPCPKEGKTLVVK